MSIPLLFLYVSVPSTPKATTRENRRNLNHLDQPDVAAHHEEPNDVLDQLCGLHQKEDGNNTKGGKVGQHEGQRRHNHPGEDRVK